MNQIPNDFNFNSVNDKIMSLPQPKNKIQAEYVWIDGTG
jgi:hypothetical protein